MTAYPGLPLPLRRGAVYPYRTGYAFCVVGHDGLDYDVRATIWLTVGEALAAMDSFIQCPDPMAVHRRR